MVGKLPARSHERAVKQSLVAGRYLQVLPQYVLHVLHGRPALDGERALAPLSIRHVFDEDTEVGPLRDLDATGTVPVGASPCSTVPALADADTAARGRHRCAELRPKSRAADAHDVWFCCLLAAK